MNVQLNIEPELYLEFKAFVRIKKGKIHGELSKAVEESLKLYILTNNGYDEVKSKKISIEKKPDKSALRRWALRQKINEPTINTENINLFNAHHIFPKSLFPDLALEDWNCVLINKGWHKELHTKYVPKVNCFYDFDWIGALFDFIEDKIHESMDSMCLDQWIPGLIQEGES